MSNASQDDTQPGSAKRFLFFLYYYPPLKGTAPKRNELISSEIAKRADFAQIFTSVKENGNQHRIETVETIEAYDYRSFLRRRTKDGALPEQTKKGRIMQSMIRLINTFPINILLGEGGMFYYLALVRKGQRAINENKITHLYSSFRPFVDHYAAYTLKKRNPEIFWIADFRDLIIDPHYGHILFPGTQQRYFKKIFKRADLLTTVSDGLAERLKEYNRNVITVRNGIRKVPDEIIPVHCKYFRIAYTGSMFLDKRNATPVFAALVDLINQDLIDLDDIRIVYAGKDSHYWTSIADQHGLDEILVNKGIVEDEEVGNIQKGACVNLLLTVSSDELQGVLTGKMIEYFEAGSPVLGIVVHQNDPELSNILDDLGIGKSFSDQPKDEQEIKNFIFTEYLHWKRTGMNRKPVNVELLKKKYSVEVTMKPLYEFMGL